jgi:predicted DNA-binding protein (UPF0278 family)
MGSEYLADSQIQGYLVHNIRLGALGWFNIETGLLGDEIKNYYTCYVSSTVNKVYHHIVDHSHSRNRVTIQQTVTTLQQIVITFPQTVIILSEHIRLVRELVNRGQNVANALYIVQHFRKSLQRFKKSLQ